MRKTLFILGACSFMLASCGQEAGFVINGTFVNPADTTVVERNAILSSDYSDYRDTVAIIDGKFTFKGNVQTPVPFTISVDGMMGGASIFLENAEFTAEIEQKGPYLYKQDVNGGETQSFIRSLMKVTEDSFAKHNIKMDELMAEYDNPATTRERKEELRHKYETAAMEADSIKNAMIDQHISENPLSYFALVSVLSTMEQASPDKTAEEFEKFANDSVLSKHPISIEIQKYLDANKHLMKGQPAPDFTLPNEKGKNKTFSDIVKKNKLTLLDFWAGWCGPCRAFNPILVDIYNQYHSKGFEIVGVSLDKSKDNWLKAIKEDKLPWIQLSDVKYWNTEPRKLYNVNYIPQNVLVDSEGKIVGSKYSEEELVKVLEEMLK